MVLLQTFSKTQYPSRFRVISVFYIIDTCISNANIKFSEQLLVCGRRFLLVHIMLISRIWGLH